MVSRTARAHTLSISILLRHSHSSQTLLQQAGPRHRKQVTYRIHRLPSGPLPCLSKPAAVPRGRLFPNQMPDERPVALPQQARRRCREASSSRIKCLTSGACSGQRNGRNSGMEGTAEWRERRQQQFLQFTCRTDRPPRALQSIPLRQV